MHALHLVALRDVAVAQRLGHLGGEVVLDGLFVHVHQALDFFFRSAAAESVFQCAAGGLKRGGGVGERAELGLKRDLPQQAFGVFGLLPVGGAVEQAACIAQAEINDRVLEIVFCAPGDRIEYHHGALDLLWRPAEAVCGRGGDGVVAGAFDGGEAVGAFGRGVFLIIPQQDLARFLRHAGVGLEEDLFGDSVGDGFALGDLAGGVGGAQLDHHV